MGTMADPPGQGSQRLSKAIDQCEMLRSTRIQPVEYLERLVYDVKRFDCLRLF
jgi:hypothetical protein